MINLIISKYGESKKIPLIEISLPFCMLLMQYSFGFLSVGLILLILIGLIYLISTKTWYVCSPFLVFFIYMIFHDLLKIFFLGSITATFIHGMQEKTAIFLLVILVSTNINEEKLFKSWKIFGLIAMLGLFYHSFIVYGLGQSVSPINILPISGENSRLWTRSYYRPMSLFTEPAAYVTYMLPLLFLCLKHDEIINAFFITISIFLSTSTSGLIFSFLLWCYNIFFEGKVKKKKLIVITIYVVGLLALLTLPIFNSTLNKLMDTEVRGNLRLLRGYEIFNECSAINKIIGIPYETVADYLLSGKANVSNINSNVFYFSYTNTISYVMIIYGIIGALLYIVMFYKLYRYNDRDMRPYLIVIVAGIFGQSIFFNSFFAMQFILLFGLSTKQNNAKLYFKIIRGKIK